MQTLIIAEKPSVAKNIATALGAKTKKDGYFEGNGYFVSYAFGHLYRLCDVKDYDPEKGKWKMAYYPFIPGAFQYKGISDGGVSKQIKTLKYLEKQSDAIINACDADREGSLIFAEIQRDLDFKKPVKRLWLTSHTPKDIKKGMDNLRDEMSNLESAGYCRQWTDWLLGINLTVLYTLKAGGGKTLKVGRVILPTLKLIYDRDKAIREFDSTPFYTLKCEFEAEASRYVGLYTDKDDVSKFKDEALLKAIEESVKGGTGTIEEKSSKIVNQNAPRLFSLTDLQGHITSKFKGFSSDGVLKIMQSLYEKKIVTYPRTASRFLDETQIADVEDSLKAVLTSGNLKGFDLSTVKFHKKKTVFNSAKVDSHPAIIPTYIQPDIRKLSPQERVVYMEVVKRFVAVFMPPAVYDEVKLVTKVDDYEFLTKGKTELDPGWKVLFPKKPSSKNEKDLDSGKGKKKGKGEDEEDVLIPNVQEGDSVPVVSANIEKGKTTPPKHYNEKTLLKAMENCGKQVEDEDRVLKGFTIGTPATRADTMKKLITEGYIQKKGQSLIITEIGVKIIDNFPIGSLLKVDFTGGVEKTLKLMENGEYQRDEYMEKITKYVVTSCEKMKRHKVETIGSRDPGAKVIGTCPDCGKEVIDNFKAYSCENSRGGACKFVLWKEDKYFKSIGKKMTENRAKSLVKYQKVKVTKIRNKNGGMFDAIVEIKKAPNGYWNYNMVMEKQTQTQTQGEAMDKAEIT